MIRDKLTRLFLAYIFIFTCSIPCVAQTYTIWPTNDGGINFNTEPPTIAPYTTINASPSATMCDRAGRLIFCYDFYDLYGYNNKNIYNWSQYHCPYITPTRSAVTIAAIGDSTKFYVVQSYDTLGCSQYNEYLLSYFEIDMTMDSERGGVMNPHATVIYPGICSKLTMFKQTNGKDYWLVARTQDTLLVIPYTATGFGYAKKFVYKAYPRDQFYQLGNLVASGDGRMLIECTGQRLYGYTFNNQTGDIVSQSVIDTSISSGPSFYDAAFSPNDSLIYTIGDPEDPSQLIFQYQRYNKIKTDLSSWIADNLTTPAQYSAIQLAPDGKIYFTDLFDPLAQFHGNRPFLGVISYPDKAGKACKLAHYVLGFKSFGNGSFGGIIGFPFSIFDPRQVKFNTTYQCKNIVVKNLSDSSYHNFTWYFGDGDSLVSDAPSVSHSYASYGKYFVRLKGLNSAGGPRWFSDSITWQNFMPQVNFSAVDSLGCQYTKSAFKSHVITDSVNAASGASWCWDFGDGSIIIAHDSLVSHRYSDTGFLNVRLIYNNGFCPDTASQFGAIHVIPAPKPGFSVSDSNGCPPLTVKITPQTLGAITHTHYDFGNGIKDTTSSPSITYQTSGNYKILQYLTGPTGCVTEDSATIHVRLAFSVAEKTNIGLATVDSNGYAYISWATWQGVSRYDLYRYTDDDTTTAVLATQTGSNFYSDPGLNTAIHSYTYYLLAEDSCNNITGRGRIGRTIKLTGALDPNLNPKLIWNPYIDWKGGVKTYNIYRKNPDSSFELINNTKDTSYRDAAFIINPAYNECYKVEAITNDTSAVSESNIFCFGNSPQIWMPDVFTPNGDSLNDLFTPVFSGIKSWNINIYSRWGVIVYSYASTSPRPSPLGEGDRWDGNFKGQPAPNGVYVYDLNATDYKGNNVKKEGTVTLQR